MALADLTASDAVSRALDEYDEIGRERFLAKYGFSRARSYFVVRNGRSYDSKAVAGAAHGYQHPRLGPLKASEFSGGDDTVKKRLEAMGFTIVVTEPRVGDVRPLELFADYSRRDVHDIFAPRSGFVAGAGSWGQAGIIEHEPSQFVLFVTFGREVADHRFDEGITTDGVVTWQSQPSQMLSDRQIRRFIEHDPERGTIHLFLRTRGTIRGGSTPMSYTYLGRLAYLTHDAERERPVYFKWQLIDAWPPPEDVLTRMGLTLTPGAIAHPPTAPAPADTAPTLVETAPPEAPTRTGKRTPDFRARLRPDRAIQDAKNRSLGWAGELAVVERERTYLRTNGREDLANGVRHIAGLEGDGAGYDVLSFNLDGSERHIEVKTTQGGAQTDFFVSANEVEFARLHPESYLLYRLYDFDPSGAAGAYYVRRGSLLEVPTLRLQPVQYVARLVAVERV